MAKKKPTKPLKKKRKRNQLPELRAGELIVHIYLAAMLGVFALFTFEQKYARMDESKYTFFSMAAYLLAFAFFCILLHTVITRRKTLLSPGGELMGAINRMSVLDYAVLAYFLVGFVSALASSNPALAFGGGRELRYENYPVMALYCLIYFIVSRFYTHREYIFFIFAACTAMVSAIGILQFYGADWFGLTASAPPISQPLGAAWFQTTLGNVNVVSTVMCLAIPMFAALYIKTAGKQRFIYLCAALVCWYQILMAQSDSGFVGLAVAFVLLLPFIVTDFTSLARLLAVLAGAALAAYAFSAIEAERVAPNVEGISGVVFGLGGALLAAAALLLLAAAAVYFLLVKNKRGFAKLRLAAALATALCVAAALMVGWFYPAEKDGGFLYEYTETMRGNIQDKFGSNRGYVWTRSLVLYESLPLGQKLIGVGPGMFASAFDPVFREESLAITGTRFDRAHNEYINTLVTMGALGLLAYLAIIVCSLARAWKYYSTPCVLALGGALLCFLAQGFFNFSVTITTPFFWIFLGMLASQAPKLELKKTMINARAL